MISWLPLLAFAVGLVLVYRLSGVARQAGTLLLVLATSWSLALLVGPAAVTWGVGAAVATSALSRPSERVRCSFELLTRRAGIIAGLLLLALFLALRFPVGENPVTLSLVPWALGALGAAWTLNPLDARERIQGQVLMVAATAAVVLLAVPGGAVAAAAAGATAVLPLLGARQLGGQSLRVLMSSLAVLLALAAAGLALGGLSLGRQSVGDLSVGFNGPVLLGVALVLFAAALSAPPGTEWSGLIAAVALISGAAALRWSALAALIALATLTDREGERPAWLGLAALTGVSVLQGLGPPALSARFETVALGLGLFLVVYAARAGLLRAVVLPTTGILVLIGISALSSGNLTRIQWIAASGALLLIGRGLLQGASAGDGADPGLGHALTAALFLLAISARDPLGLGPLAAVLLLLDIAIVRLVPAPSSGLRIPDRLSALARSSWPPSVRFAGATLAVVAALQASLVLGLLAAACLALLQVAPLLDARRRQRLTERPRSVLGWLVPALSLAAGVGPAIVLRMLRL